MTRDEALETIRHVMRPPLRVDAHGSYYYDEPSDAKATEAMSILEQERYVTKYEYCCEIGSYDNMAGVQKRAADGWRIISVDGRSGCTYIYMERPVPVAKLTVTKE